MDLRAQAVARQTQRQVIAAMYWRAGAHMAESDRARVSAGSEACGYIALTGMRYALEEHDRGMECWHVASEMERVLRGAS